LQNAVQEGTAAHLRRGQRQRKKDAEEVATKATERCGERVPIERNRTNRWAEIVEEKKLKDRLATSREFKLQNQGRERRQSFFLDDRGGFIETASRFVGDT